MLSDAVVSQVHELLADGLSARKVALTVGVSRGSVHNIAQRRPESSLARQRQEPEQLSEPVRCQTCRAKINVVPCVRCAARAKRNTSLVTNRSPSTINQP